MSMMTDPWEQANEKLEARVNELEAALRWYFGATTIAGLDQRHDLLYDAYYGREDGTSVLDPLGDLLAAWKADQKP